MLPTPRNKGKFGANAMKRVAAERSLPDFLAFDPEKCPGDKAGYNFLPAAVWAAVSFPSANIRHSFFPLEWTGTRPTTSRRFRERINVKTTSRKFRDEYADALNCGDN